MDLSARKQLDVFEYTLIAPDGEKTDVVFTLAGPTHPARAALEKRMRARGLRSFNKEGKTKLPEDPDDIDDKIVERLVVCVLGWENLSVDGKAVEFSPKAARELFENDYFGWVRDAVALALNDAELFTRSSSTVS